MFDEEHITHLNEWIVTAGTDEPSRVPQRVLLQLSKPTMPLKFRLGPDEVLNLAKIFMSITKNEVKAGMTEQFKVTVTDRDEVGLRALRMDFIDPSLSWRYCLLSDVVAKFLVDELVTAANKIIELSKK